MLTNYSLPQYFSSKNIIVFLEVWLATGLFIQLVGSFIINNGYRTWVYLLFYLPLILLFVFNFKKILLDLKLNLKLYSLLFFFLFYFGFTTLWSENENLSKTLQMSLLSFLYIIGVAIVSKKEKYIYIILKYSVFCIALFSALFFFKTYIINGSPLTHRISSTGFEGWGSLENAQIFGMFLGAFFIIGFFLTMKNINTSIEKLLLFSSLVILFYAFFTYSRTMWVAIFLVFFCHLLIKKYYKILLYSLATLTLSISIVLFIFPEIYDKFIYRTGFSFRPQIWLLTISQIMEKPLLGHGSNSIFNYVVTQTVNGKEMSHSLSHPHNLYLSIFYYSGLIGITFYFFILVEILRTIKKHINDYLVYLAFGLILFSLAEQIFDIGAIVTKPNEYYLILWLPVGILLGRITYIMQRDTKN